MGSKARTPQHTQQMPPPQTQLNTTGWGGMGPNMPQNPMQMGSHQTGIGTGAPAWAQGDFAMPWWGQQAPNTGAAMMQQQDPVGYGNQSRMGLAPDTPPQQGSLAAQFSGHSFGGPGGGRTPQSPQEMMWYQQMMGM